MLTIGDFAQLTHLSRKTLRHYHEVGLLEPEQIDGPEPWWRGAGRVIDEAPIAQDSPSIPSQIQPETTS